MMDALLVVVVLPFVLSWLGCAFLIRFGPRLGLVDAPDPKRKIHSRAIPLGGGLAITLPMYLVAWLLAPLLHDLPYPGPWDSRWFFGLILVILGLGDDLQPLSWQLRLGFHIMAAAIVVLACLPRSLSPGERFLAALWIAAMINAFNMLDNMDALSGGVAFIAVAYLAFIFNVLTPNRPPEAAACLTLLATLAGFLWFNRPPARLFMGDAGSTFLGFFVGLTSVQAAVREGGPSLPFLFPPCLCAVACYDMLSVIALRLYQRRSPFRADKQHLSHRLVQWGLSRPVAVGVILLGGLVSGFGALLMVVLKEPWPCLAIAGLQLILCVVLAAAELLSRRSSRPAGAEHIADTSSK